MDGLRVDPARIPLPAEPNHVLHVAAPGRVARDVAVPSRSGTRIRVRLANAAPSVTAEPQPEPSPSTISAEVTTIEIGATPHAPPKMAPRTHLAPPARPSSSSTAGVKPITRPPY
jgi:hypothetical protein